MHWRIQGAPALSPTNDCLKHQAYVWRCERWAGGAVFSSFHELIQSRGVRRLSVLRQKWLDRDQTWTGWSPGGRAPRVCLRSRSKVTWYGHFCAGTKIAFSRRQMAGLRPNLHTMISRGRTYMHNTVVTATSKLKSIYDGVVFTSVCMTPS